MIEILQFIFSSFWIWLGTLILICAPCAIIADGLKWICYYRSVKGNKAEKPE